jgi:hypothetical protein
MPEIDVRFFTRDFNLVEAKYRYGSEKVRMIRVDKSGSV